MANLTQLCIDGICSEVQEYSAGAGISITNGVISATADTNIFEVVETLPEASTADDNKIYVVPKSTAKSGNTYEEWYVNEGEWELIGEEQLDLANYYNKTEVDNALDDKVDKEDGKGLSTNDFTNADKAKLDSIDTSNFITCDTLSDCQTISDMQTAISGKQDSLTAGDYITIGTDGTISGNYTKNDILSILGYTEIPVTKTDGNGTKQWVFLGKEVTE